MEAVVSRWMFAEDVFLMEGVVTMLTTALYYVLDHLLAEQIKLFETSEEIVRYLNL